MTSQPDGQDSSEWQRAPRSLMHLFLGFTWLAIQGFGAAAPIAYRELVDRQRWLSPQTFAEDWAVAQLMPGPNAINLTLMVGDRYFGWRGAAASLAGMLCMPVLISVSLAVLYARHADNPLVSGALYAMGAVVAGLIIGTGLKLLSSIDKSVIGPGLTLATALVTFLAVGVMRWPLIWVLLTLAVSGTWWANRQLARLRTGQLK